MNAQPKDDFAAAFAEFADAEDKGTSPAPAAAEGGTDGQADNAGAAAAADDGAAGTGDAGVTGSDSAGDAGDPAGGKDGTGDQGGAEAPAAAADASKPAEQAPAADAGTAPAPAAGDDEEILRKLSKLVKETPAAEEAPAAQPTQQEEQPLYSADETKLLEDYEKDWSDVARAEELKRRAFGRDLVTYVFNQIAPEVRNLRELAETLANRAHFTDLREKLGDIPDSLHDEVSAWADQQPTYLQAAYKEVLSKGTVDEVADLVERYRKETGKAAGAAPATSAGGPELSSEAKQAAAALAPVSSSKRSVIEQADDKSNFDAAFARFNDMFKD